MRSWSEDRNRWRTTKAPRITCPACGKLITITPGGWVRLHGPRGAKCWYSDTVVAEPVPGYRPSPYARPSRKRSISQAQRDRAVAEWRRTYHRRAS